MDAFVWAQHDPSAMLFGTHLFVIGEMVGFVMQTTLAVVGIVCGCVYSMLHAEYLATCCYSVYPPAALTVAVYGDCRDSGSLAYIGSNGGHCGYGMPATQVVLLIVTIAAFVGDAVVYVHYYKMYVPEVVKMLRTAGGPRSGVRALMLFPVTGIVLGSYERVTRFAFVFYLRLLLLIGGCVMALYMYVALELNYAWGCYTSFQDDSGGDIDELVHGRCDDDASAIVAMTGGGQFRLWTSSLIVWCTASVVWFLWGALYVMRWMGWVPHVPTLQEELTELLRYEDT